MRYDEKIINAVIPAQAGIQQWVFLTSPGFPPARE